MAHCVQDHLLGMRDTAEASLIRNLPKLRAEDASWIDRRQVHALLAAMDLRRPQMTVAILNAVGSIGDRRAKQYVLGLYGRMGNSRKPQDEQVRNAVTECLLALREHEERAQQADALLRGSQEPEPVESTILLRASGNTRASDSSQLLRTDCAVQPVEVVRKGGDLDGSS